MISETTLRRQAAKVLKRTGPLHIETLLAALQREPRWRVMTETDLEQRLSDSPWFEKTGPRWSSTHVAEPASERAIETASLEILRTNGPLRGGTLTSELKRWGFGVGYAALTLSQSPLITRWPDGVYWFAGQIPPSVRLNRPSGNAAARADPLPMRRRERLVKIVVELDLSKRTPGTYRYETERTDSPITNIYIRRSRIVGTPPERITVTVEDAKPSE